MTRRSDRILLYAGSFDPFTRGHLRIVERALAFADKVIVAVGYNLDKPGGSPVEIREEDIRTGLSSLPGDLFKKTDVISFHGLTAEIAKSLGATALLRGVRSVADFEYERNLADINLKILDLDTMILCAEPEYSYISSSAVRELASYGHDISSLLPSSKSSGDQ